jgi:hypothetical protein
MPSTGVTLSYTFATQPGPIPLNYLDTNFGQLSTQANLLTGNWFVDSGSVNNVIIAPPSPLSTTLVAGMLFQVKIANSNTAGVTFTVSPSASKALLYPDLSALPSGALLSGSTYIIGYDGTQFILLSSNVVRVTVNASGAVSIGPPAAGTALSVTSLVGAAAASFTDATNYTLAITRAGTAAALNSSAGLAFGVNGVSGGAGTVSTSGAWSFPAATGANTVSIAASANNYCLALTGNSTAATSFGMNIQAGTTAADYALRVLNYGASATFLRLAGDGSGILGPITWAAANNVTIAPPSSGDTLTVGPSATSGALIAASSALTNGSGASAGTLTNAPAAGNPTKWIKINDAGTIRAIPAW